MNLIDFDENYDFLKFSDFFKDKNISNLEEISREKKLKDKILGRRKVLNSTKFEDRIPFKISYSLFMFNGFFPLFSSIVNFDLVDKDVSVLSYTVTCILLGHLLENFKYRKEVDSSVRNFEQFYLENLSFSNESLYSTLEGKIEEIYSSIEECDAVLFSHENPNNLLINFDEDKLRELNKYVITLNNYIAIRRTFGDYCNKKSVLKDLRFTLIESLVFSGEYILASSFANRFDGGFSIAPILAITALFGIINYKHGHIRREAFNKSYYSSFGYYSYSAFHLYNQKWLDMDMDDLIFKRDTAAKALGQIKGDLYLKQAMDDSLLIKEEENKIKILKKK